MTEPKRRLDILVRVIDKNERWTKLCQRCKTFYIPNEYRECDWCLLVEIGGVMPPLAGGCCSCVERGYTKEQVAALLRRARGEKVVVTSGGLKLLGLDLGW